LSERFNIIILINLLSLILIINGCERDFNPVISEKDNFCNPSPPDSIPGKIGEWQLAGLENNNISYIKTIAINPEKPYIIFAGSSYDFSANIDAYLFRSIDYGSTWDTLGYAFGNGRHFNDIAYDPSNSNIIYVANGRVLFKSSDCGETWRDITGDIYVDWETSISDIAINPVNTNILYAGTGGFFGGCLYKSKDGGMHWRKQTTNVGSVRCIAIDDQDPNIIYLGTADIGDVLKSTDGGENWEKTGLRETCVFVYDILIDDNTIYALLDYNTKFDIPGIKVDLGVMRSNDDGETWVKFNDGLPMDNTFFARRIIKDYTSGELYITVRQGTDNGIYKMPIGGSTWVKIGIEWIEEAYTSCDLALCPQGYFLYYGSKGFYRMRLK